VRGKKKARRNERRGGGEKKKKKKNNIKPQFRSGREYFFRRLYGMEREEKKKCNPSMKKKELGFGRSALGKPLGGVLGSWIGISSEGREGLCVLVCAGRGGRGHRRS